MTTPSREALIKSLELEKDFKGVDSRRALQAGAKPNSQPLPYLFLTYRHTPAKDILVLKIWLAQKPSDLISASLADKVQHALSNFYLKIWVT